MKKRQYAPQLASDTSVMSVNNLLQTRPFQVDINPNQQAPQVQQESEALTGGGFDLTMMQYAFNSSGAALGQPLQAKSTIGQPNDKYEQEADRVARPVVQRVNEQDQERSQPKETQISWLQHQELETNDTAPRDLQLKPVVQCSSSEEIAPLNLESEIVQARSSGQPLADTIRKPMEQAFGRDFSRVKIHTDARSDRLNRSIQAQAFTTKQDVFFRHGAFNPSSRSGQELLAHELTHTIQQGTPQLRRTPFSSPVASVDTQITASGHHPINLNNESIQSDTAIDVHLSTCQPFVNRKLAGTRAALEEMGSAPSKKSKVKAKIASVKEKVKADSKKEGSGKYAQIFGLLSDYENLETKLLELNRALTKSEKDSLITHLKKIETLCEIWLAQNKQDEITPKAAQDALLSGASADDLMAKETQGERRVHALKLLLPRIRHEMMEIDRGKFHQTKQWSDKTLDKSKSKDDWAGGQVNRLDKVVHGQEEGVFIEDRTWDDAGTAGKDLGIPDVDPNAGARSVAMYQLAKLLDFDIDVIARTEFATHTSKTNKKNAPLKESKAKFGVHMEMAKGQEAAQTPTTFTASQAQAKGGNTVSLEDPVLQRALNALQLIDAIAGQLDRHWHNYYIATDSKGNVTGVVGIDLDMAFAIQHTTVDPVPVDAKGRPVTKANFVGMPELVDQEFAKAITEVSDAEVTKLLLAYLAPGEVKSTVIRFRMVQDACQKLLAQKKTVTTWDATTAADQKDEQTSYLGKMKAGLIAKDFVQPATEKLQGMLDKTGIGQMVEANNIIKELASKMVEGSITPIEGNDLIDQLVSTFLLEPTVQAALQKLTVILKQGKEHDAKLKLSFEEIEKQIKAISQRDKSYTLVAIPGKEKEFDQAMKDKDQITQERNEATNPKYKTILRERVAEWLQKTVIRFLKTSPANWASLRSLPIPKVAM